MSGAGGGAAIPLTGFSIGTVATSSEEDSLLSEPVPESSLKGMSSKDASELA